MLNTFTCYEITKIVDGKRTYGFLVTKPIGYREEEDVHEEFGYESAWDAWKAAGAYMDKTFGKNNWNF